jgi:two-component system invasion response regulator UvrY
MIRVLVADDHAVVRRGVLQILSEAPDLVAAGEASTGREALQAILEDDYDVIVLDISMPGGSGLEVLEQIRDLRPALHVLILTMYPEEQYAVRALKAGAAGYLTKESVPTELTAAIRRVSQGHRYITPSLAERLADRLGADVDRPRHESLSNREYQVMCELAAGKTVSDIAAELSLSRKTVSTYRRRVLDKLNLDNTAEIMHYAIQRGLIK